MPVPNEPKSESWELPDFLLAAPFGVCLVDIAGVIRAANPEAGRILGLPADPTGKAFRDCGDEPSGRILAEWIEREAATETGLAPASVRFARPDEAARTLEFSSTRGTSLPEGGRLILVHEVSIDAPESGVDRSILQSLMEHLPDHIYFKDRNSRFLRINQSLAAHFGLANPEQVTGRTDFDFFTPEHARPAFEEEQEILLSGVPVINREQKETLHDGRTYWVSTTKLPFRDQDDRLIGTFGISRDVTENKRFEQKLLDERNLLRTLIDILPSRIFIKDVDSHFVINNRAHLDHLGLETQEEATGKTTLDFHPGKRSRQALEEDREVLLTGTPIIDREKTYLDSSGKPVWSLTTKVPLRDSTGKIVGLVGISHDITARKRVEEELTRRNLEMRTDLKMAREIQQSFLIHRYPTFPRGAVPDESAIRFCHRYLPASSLAGDFFDIFPISDHEAGILICDVMGHGVRAALVTAFIRGLVEELMPLAARPGAFLSELNRALLGIFRQSESPFFVTTLYCVMDIGLSQMRYANGGHLWPYLIRPSPPKVERIRPENLDPEPALGLIDHFPYSTWVYPLVRDDRILAFTDGLYEVDGPGGEQLGESWLHQQITEKRDLPLDRLFDHLLAEAHHQSGRDEFDDDVCLVGARIDTCAREERPLLFDA